MVAGLPQPLDPPQYLGDLVLLARLGEGGMASVFLGAAGHGDLARPAAIKLLKRDLPDHDYTTRFLDEAKVVVHLHHNNIVDVRAAGEHEGQLFIAMECIEGRDLADVWDRCAEVGRAFPVHLAVHLVREVLRGLHYAHTFPGLGLVHRDVSPSNVLLDWSGAVRLADFGLATSTLKASLTLPGVVFGKVGYMSPEQARRETLDGRADVFACGVMLWELLTGRPMREGANLTTARVAQEVATPPSMLSKRVDAVLDGIVVKATAHDRDERYGSAAEMLEDLGSWLATHAPQTTQERVADFMTELYPGQCEQERAHRDQMFERVRTGAPMHRRRPGDRIATDELGDAPEIQLASDSEEIPAGYVVAHRYRVGERLGKGGMGTVYLAEHLTVGRKVAMKVLTRDWSANPSVARRFRAEARAASAAGHANIVEVFDAGELQDGRLYLVMELLAGRNLYEEVEAHGPMEIARACRVVRDVGRAIRAAHEVGVIHRDLKPDNVMLARRGREGEPDQVKVLDFGISANTEQQTEEERLTMPGSALGTPEYMAPEQCRGEAVTERFDIYALGVIFFEVLVGHPPFEHESFVEVMAQKCRDRAPSVATFRKDVPSRLVRLISDCLEIDPAQRPESVSTFLNRLDEILHAMPRAPSGPNVVAGAFTAGRRRTVAVAMAAGVVAALGLGGWVVRASTSGPNPGLPAPVAQDSRDEDREEDREEERSPAVTSQTSGPSGPEAGPQAQVRAAALADANPDAPTGSPLAADKDAPEEDEQLLADAAPVKAAHGAVGGSSSNEASPTADATGSRSTTRRRSTRRKISAAHCERTRADVDADLRAGRFQQAYRGLDFTCWSGDRTAYYALKARLLYELGRDEECIDVGKKSSATSVDRWVGRCKLRAGG